MCVCARACVRMPLLLQVQYSVLQLDENMKRAVKRDAVNKETFHFRTSIIPGEFE